MVVGAPPKQWLAIECLWELSQRERTLPEQVESVISLTTWLAMVSRGLLSVLDQTYVWTRENREIPKPLIMPREVRRELAALSSILPLVRQRLDAPWLSTTYMFDASEQGGGICESEADIDELREEAKWAVRGGWMTYAGGEEIRDLWKEDLEGLPGQSPDKWLPTLTTAISEMIYFVINLFSGHRRKGTSSGTS